MRGDRRAFGRAGALWLAVLGIAGPLFGQGILTVTPGRTIGAAAGTGVVGYTGDGAAATIASLANPRGVAYDASGNQYIADAQNHVVREISSAGTITTVAGSGIEGYAGDGGPATAALLDTPTGVAVDASGNLYIADSHNHRIREVSQGTITTLAGNGTPGFSGDGGVPSAAQFSLPTAVAVDAAGTVYVADTNNQRVRAIRGGQITTIAGDGEQMFAGEDVAAPAASLDTPTGVAVDAAGNVYIADRHNQRVRMLGSNGHLTTVAGSAPTSFNGGYGGDGTAASGAALAKPTGVAVDAAGNLYIADSGNQRIREVGGGVITTLVGSGQQGSAGEGSTPTGTDLNAPKGVAVNAAGELAIADTLNQRLLESSYPQLVFSSTGVGLSAASQSVTLTNSGTAAITVTSSSYSGNFGSVAGGTCSAPPIQLQAGDNCTVNIGFLPLSVGSLSGSVTFGGVGVVPQSIALSGVGVQTGDTVSLSSSAVTSQFGDAVTFSANVAVAGNVDPTGTVSFKDGGTLIGSVQTLMGKTASLTTTLSTGTHDITVKYNGDSNFAANSSSVLEETIGLQTGTTVALSSSALSSKFGQPVTLSVNVTSKVGVVPTGTVSFSDGGTPIGSAQTLAGGVASWTTTLSTGTHSIAASYSGDGNFAKNSSLALVETIGFQTATTVSLSSNAAATLLGQPVTLTVNVASKVSVVPTGTVSFYDGGTLLGLAQTLASGAASLTTTALSAGTHSITAVYGGDSNFAVNSSSALVETIIDFSLAPTGSSGSGSGGDSGSSGGSGGSGSGGSGGSVQTVVPGQPATYGFSVQPIGGTTLTFPVTLSVKGLPPGATVVFSPPVILVGASATSFTMTIQTPPPVAFLRDVRDGGTISLAGCVLLLPFSGWLRRRGRGGIGLVCLALLSCVPLLGLTGCGTGNGFLGQGPQSYSIQVVGTVNGATTLQHITTVTLTVQ
jgi:Bacterial Ig-like domain (group 3)/NHL repeat